MRTDDDTWDITTSVGATALLVAASRAPHAQRGEPLAVDPYAEVFCRAVGGSWADVLDGKAPDHRLKTEFGEVFQTFQGARTRFFDAFLGRATAEGLLMYLPASAQEQLCAGIDSLAAPGSGVALEEMQPMHADALEAKRAEERAFPHQPSTFFNLIYHELHRDAAAWFGEHGWDAQATLVANYFVQLGRPLPEPDTDAGQMLNSSSLVTAKKL